MKLIYEHKESLNHNTVCEKKYLWSTRHQFLLKKKFFERKNVEYTWIKNKRISNNIDNESSFLITLIVREKLKKSILE